MKVKTRFIVSLIALLLATTSVFSQTKKDPKAVLIGYWKSDVAVVELKAKNVAVFNGNTLEWSASDKVIVLGNSEGTLTFPYTLKGDILTVWSDGQKIIYMRTTEDEVAEAAPRRSGSANSGSVSQDLVGKWCYSANVTASGGGRQSDLCFILNGNGTYEYHGETSNSNIYGGSNSSSSDAGRWSATATTLTAQSNSGKTVTYQLERRNHPKTGDPMLIVDGDAFVTFYQKRPW